MIKDINRTKDKRGRKHSKQNESSDFNVWKKKKKDMGLKNMKTQNLFFHDLYCDKQPIKYN